MKCIYAVVMTCRYLLIYCCLFILNMVCKWQTAAIRVYLGKLTCNAAEETLLVSYTFFFFFLNKKKIKPNYWTVADSLLSARGCIFCICLAQLSGKAFSAISTAAVFSTFHIHHLQKEAQAALRSVAVLGWGSVKITLSTLVDSIL